MSKRRGQVRIGTSGWSYDDWVGPFYPEGLSAEERLGHYAKTFDAVEINNTFYQLPEKKALRRWRDTPGADFLFACKASRFTTHMKKLKDPKPSTARFFDAVDALGRKLGPILFQLPPNWRCNAERLGCFLEALPPGHRYAFEFRDASWHVDAVLELLREHEAAWCIWDMGGERSPLHVTTDLAYIRLHGPHAAYRGSYDGRTLSGWTKRIAAWLDDGIDVHCYFDNDEKGYAPKDAQRLCEMVRARR